MQTMIRPATRDDLPAINALYNYYVSNSVATFALQEMSAAERETWWAEHEGRYPVLVAEGDGRVCGWASLSRYAGRCGYRHTVEDSVYVDPDLHGWGIGGALLASLVSLGAARSFHSVVALIASDQVPSVRLHERRGFARVGVLREVGYKFDRWLDVVIMQRLLEPPAQV